MFSSFILLFFCTLPGLHAYRDPQDTEHCMDENYLCFDVGKDGRWSLGDRPIPESDLIFSVLAERELLPKNLGKEHVWHFFVNSTQKQANVTMQIVHKGQQSSRKLMIRREMLSLRDPTLKATTRTRDALSKGQTHIYKLRVDFEVKKGNKWISLPSSKKQSYFQDEMHDDDAERVQIRSTGNFSKVLKLEQMKYGLWVNIWCWDEFVGHRNITVFTPEDFFLFRSKREQRILGTNGEGPEAVTVAIIVAMAVLAAMAVILVIVFVVMRSRRSHLTTTTLHSDASTFKSHNTTLSDLK